MSHVRFNSMVSKGVEVLRDDGLTRGLALGKFGLPWFIFNVLR